LWAPPGGLDLEQRLGEAFELREYGERREFQAAGFRITALPVNHPNGHGLRITDGERVYAHSGDRGPHDTRVELARDADLLLCEATQDEAEPAAMHLRASDAQAVAARARVRRLVLIHRPAELPAPDGVVVAHDGLELDV